MKEIDKCTTFLKLNNWIDNTDYDFLVMEGFDDPEYLSFNKEGCLSIDINKEEIVFLSDIGDILHLPVNYYALIGALIEYRQLPFNYVGVKG